MPRLRRPTYAETMSTLAVGLALTGSAYAATLVTSRQIENRTVRGIDVQRNSLSGNEIKESGLGIVPQAARATVATTALQAASASQAESATTFGGRPPGAYALVGGWAIGSGSLVATTPETILEVPELGLRLTTDGDADDDPKVMFRNTQVAPNGGRLRVSHVDVHIFSATLGTGTAVGIDPAPVGTHGFSVMVTDIPLGTAEAVPGAGPSVLVTCGFDTGALVATLQRVTCWAMREVPAG